MGEVSKRFWLLNLVLQKRGRGMTWLTWSFEMVWVKEDASEFGFKLLFQPELDDIFPFKLVLDVFSKVYLANFGDMIYISPCDQALFWCPT